MNSFDYKNGDNQKIIRLEPFGQWFYLEPNDIFRIEWDNDEEQLNISEDIGDMFTAIFELYDEARYYINTKRVNCQGNDPAINPK